MFGFVSTTPYSSSCTPNANIDPPPQRKTLDIITLFHKANSPASTRIVNLLKQASANASQAANEAPSSGPTVTREPFDLNVTEDPPTADQVETILEYVPAADIGQVVSGAGTVTEAMRNFHNDAGSFQRPMVSLFLVAGCLGAARRKMGAWLTWCRLSIGITARL